MYGAISRKEPGLALLGTFFIPGFSHFYIGKVGEGIAYTLITWFLYMLVIGFFIHIYFFLNSYSFVKKFNQLNGYPD